MAVTTTKLLPEEGNRPALEGEDEEEARAVYLNDNQGGSENDAMSSFKGDAQQEDANDEFQKHVRDNVGRFAGPPPLMQVNTILDYTVDMALHTFIPTG